MSEPFISINELAKRLNVPAHTLRYWEKAFAGEVRPITGAGGRRYYRECDANKIAAIQNLLYNKKYTIKGVKKLLADGDLSGVGNRKSGVVMIHPLGEFGEPKTNQCGDTIHDSRLTTHDIDEALELLRRARAELAAA